MGQKKTRNDWKWKRTDLGWVKLTRNNAVKIPYLNTRHKSPKGKPTGVPCRVTKGKVHV